MKTRNLPYPCNSFEFVKSVEGSALMITAVVVMAMVTVSAVLLNDVITHGKLVSSYENNYLVRYAVDAGLEQVKYQAKTSAYTGTRNVWLMSNSSTAGTLAINDLMINNIPVDVTLYDLTNGWYRAVSSATKNYESYRVAVDIRESVVNSLFKYAYATTSGVNGGDTALRLDGLADVINGDVHTNGRAVFGGRYSWPLPGGISTYGIPVNGNLTAVNGVGTWVVGREDNAWAEGDLVGGSVSGTIDGHVSPVAFPVLNDIAWNLQPSADDYPQYFVHWSNPLYAPYGDDTGGLGIPFNTRITLLGTQIQIEFMSQANPGTVLHTTTLPLPNHKLLWIDGGTSVKGEINGRLSIAATYIAINGNIRYIDNESDRAYLLKKNGVVVDPASTGTESWTAANGYTYEVNPGYNPMVPSNLTLQGGVQTELGWGAAAAPYNLEVHAAILGAYWSCGYTGDARGNLRMVGSVVNTLGRNDADATNYYRLSAEIIHDPNLLTNAPEWYPTSGGSNIPTFFAWRKY